MSIDRSPLVIDRPYRTLWPPAECLPEGAARDTLAYRLSKRLLDLCVSAMAIVLLSPVVAVLAILIKATDGGPVYFWQIRAGRNGVPIHFPKFRTMRTDAEKLKSRLLEWSDCDGPAFKMRNDPRVTRCGGFMRKHSLDELPQLFLVFSGKLSLVGPRPQLLEETYFYTDRQRQRLLVKPGLVCLREVSGRSNLSFDQWLELDLKYIRERSFSKDFSILFRAFKEILTGDGAY